MVSPHEIGLYINPGSRSGAKQLVAPFLDDQRVLVDSIPFREHHSSLPPRIIVVGGERSVGTVVREIYRCGDNPTLGIIPGGSGNVTHNILRDRGHIATLSDFIAGSETGVVTFRPGKVGGIIFNNQVGFGGYERASGTINEALRFLPDRLRMMLSKTFAAIPAVFSEEKTDIYSVSRNIGGKLVFPRQDFLGDTITHGQIVGRFKTPKLAMTLLLWQIGLGLHVPEGLFHTTEEKSFKPRVQSHCIWIDGDTSRNPLHGEVEVSRADRGIRIVSL